MRRDVLLMDLQKMVSKWVIVFRNGMGQRDGSELIGVPALVASQWRRDQTEASDNVTHGARVVVILKLRHL
jgi:hypothetical protein